MACKNYNSSDGYCYKSGIIINYEGPHDIPMECAFGGDVQKCLDNLMEINNQNILWKAYATIRIKQTNPNALEFAQKLEKERTYKVRTPKHKKVRS